jgi:NADH-ubiquinone oxidoreductase chain 6
MGGFNHYVMDLNNTFNSFWYISEGDYLNKSFSVELSDKEIAFVTSNIWDGNLADTSHITTIGNIIYSSYAIWLVIVSIILLLAMTGAIVITIKQKKI